MKRKIFTTMTVIALAAVVVFVGTCDAQRRHDKDGWEPPQALLGSTAARRFEAAKRLDIHRGGRIVLLASTKCADCDRVAVDLKTLRVGGIIPGSQVVAFVEDTPERAAQWREKLGIRYPVRAISAEDWNDFAGEVTILPTVVLMNDGVARAARKDAPKAFLP